jgi:hypothetical protein
VTVEERAALINLVLIIASPGIVVLVGGVLIWLDTLRTFP